VRRAREVDSQAALVFSASGSSHSTKLMSESPLARGLRQLRDDRLRYPFETSSDRTPMLIGLFQMASHGLELGSRAKQ
jgi:hypothetical protein